MNKARKSTLKNGIVETTKVYEDDEKLVFVDFRFRIDRVDAWEYNPDASCIVAHIGGTEHWLPTENPDDDIRDIFINNI